MADKILGSTATATVKDKGNGLIEVVNSVLPINYKKDGKWVEMDKTILPKGNVFVCESMPFKFSTLPGPKLGFSYTDDTGTTTFELQGDADTSKITLLQNAIWFDDALPDIDIGFVIIRRGIRTLKRIKSEKATRDFIWNVTSVGSPARFDRPVGRDNENNIPTNFLNNRRDLEIVQEVGGKIVNGITTTYTIKESWTGNVITFTKPHRIPRLTNDPIYPVTLDPTVGPITMDGDDGNETDGVWLNQYYGITAGSNNVNLFSAGVRFTNVTVPQGATINSAALDFDVTLVYGAVPVNLTVQGDNVDNAPAWSDTSKPSSGFTGTTATVVWGVPATGTQSITITTIVQELVNRAGWVSGNAQRFALLNTGLVNSFMQADASDASGGNTHLTITYGEASTPARRRVRRGAR